MAHIYLIGEHATEDHSQLDALELRCGLCCNRIGFDSFASPEVEHLHVTIAPHYDVRRLNITMDDSSCMRRTQRGSTLNAYVAHFEQRHFLQALCSLSVTPSTNSIVMK